MFIWLYTPTQLITNVYTHAAAAALTFSETCSEWPHKSFADSFRPDTFASLGAPVPRGICLPGGSVDGSVLETAAVAAAAVAASRLRYCHRFGALNWMWSVMLRQTNRAFDPAPKRCE